MALYYLNNKKSSVVINSNYIVAIQKIMDTKSCCGIKVSTNIESYLLWYDSEKERDYAYTFIAEMMNVNL